MGLEGSSPHARGTLSRTSPYSFPVRIIPACAGNTYPAASNAASTWDHPRMRGEHIDSDLFTEIMKGSSPHARGTLWQGWLAGGQYGIIPACAGNTQRDQRQDRPKRDHPRMRGEHEVQSCPPISPLGSSPHARGTLIDDEVGARLAGIIPACAGNTSMSPSPSMPFRDHPRMRGEHCVIEVDLDCFLGSSPHARGTHAERMTVSHTHRGSSPHARGTLLV